MLGAIERRYGSIVGWALTHRALTLVIAVRRAGRLDRARHPGTDRVHSRPRTARSSASTSSCRRAARSRPHPPIAEAVAADVRAHAPAVTHHIHHRRRRAWPGADQPRPDPGGADPEQGACVSPGRSNGLGANAPRRVKDAMITGSRSTRSAGRPSAHSRSSSTSAAATWDELVHAAEALGNELGRIRGFVDLDTTYRGGQPRALDRDRSRGRRPASACPSPAWRARAGARWPATRSARSKKASTSTTSRCNCPEAQQANLRTLAGLKVRSMAANWSTSPTWSTSTSARARPDRREAASARSPSGALEGMPLGEATRGRSTPRPRGWCLVSS